MSLWVLDSDTLSLWFHGQSSVSRRVASTESNDLAVTIVTVEEVLRGWYTQIRRAKNDAQLARSYESLQQAVQFTSEVRILPFDVSSIQRFRQLRTVHRRSGTNDLRIASIVLENSGILVTRNTADFAGIEGLDLEDWSS